uniref:Uncharacterized protein n=1 Tax=Panagrolaimus sp. JU765 TaxID=591449 RepID=A0AC34Q4S8_9BILA
MGSSSTIFVLFFVVFSNAFPNGTVLNAKTPKPPREDYHSKPLDETDVIQFNDTVEFHANQTWTHVRTDAVSMTFAECVQFRYFITGTRTRLRVYMCKMGEDGFCYMEKFKPEEAETPKEGCKMLFAWSAKPGEYAVHVQFERRPRRFSDKLKEERYRRRRRLGRASQRLVGKISLESIRKCQDVCP